MGFNDLNLNKALLNALNDLEYIEPTPIQVESFPVIMSGRDVIGVAQTGTGKTFAYLLPLLRLLSFNKDGHPRVMVVVPTRELALQVVGEIEKLTKYMTVRTVAAYGGTNIKTQKAAIGEGVDIVVGTPGRLMDLGMTHILKFKYIKKVVIDEVDEMFNLGFRTQLKNLFDMLPERRQNIMFSATIDEQVEQLEDVFFFNPVKIEIAATGTPVDKIHQSAYYAHNFNTKVNLLRHLLATEEAMSKVLVFAPTKKIADLIFERLEEQFGDELQVIHSNKSQNFRIRAVESFHKGEVRVLLATDIIARGLDVSEVTHVINFDTPTLPQNYIHRIGRTGRADKEGISITFVADGEEEYLMAIEYMMDLPVPQLEMPEEVEVSTELLPFEEPELAGMKNYRTPIRLKSGGAFHEKKAKNKKVNRAQEKRNARKAEKRKSARGAKAKRRKK